MAYPPPPYADAICGEFVCGEAICGAWWAYPTPAGLLLGGEPPVLVIISGDVVLPAGLGLGAWVPVGAGQLYGVPSAGLRLGAELPTVDIDLVVVSTPAGLLLGAVVPGVTISTKVTPPQAVLLLGAILPEAAGKFWMIPDACVDDDLTPDTETEFVLVPAGSIDIDLDPEECL